MALKACYECGKEFSDQAARCIHCGARSARTSTTGKAFGIAFLVFAGLIFALWLIGTISRSQMSPEELKSLDAIKQCDRIAEVMKSSAQAHECFEMRADHGMRFGYTPR